MACHFGRDGVSPSVPSPAVWGPISERFVPTDVALSEKSTYHGGVRVRWDFWSLPGGALEILGLGGVFMGKSLYFLGSAVATSRCSQRCKNKTVTPIIF